MTALLPPTPEKSDASARAGMAMRDRSGSVASQWGIGTTGAVSEAYGVQALETTVVIDPQGQIAYRSDGAIPPAQLLQIVRKLA